VRDRPSKTGATGSEIEAALRGKSSGCDRWHPGRKPEAGENRSDQGTWRGNAFVVPQFPPLLIETTRYDRFRRKTSRKSRNASPCQREGRQFEPGLVLQQTSAPSGSWLGGVASFGVPPHISSPTISCALSESIHRHSSVFRAAGGQPLRRLPPGLAVVKTTHTGQGDDLGVRPWLDLRRPARRRVLLRRRASGALGRKLLASTVALLVRDTDHLAGADELVSRQREVGFR
jgi:hypothetical protein